MRPRLPHAFLIFISLVSASVASAGEPRPELPCLERRFSIVAHIVLDSLGQPGISEGAIDGQVAALNGYFDDICVSFEVCEFRYIPNFQWDSLEAVGGYRWGEMLTANHRPYRINVFYVASVTDLGDATGFASLAGITNPDGGGIAIQKSSGSMTLTHEMGHFWGLEHTFAGPELVNGSDCATAGDAICDTPADPYSGPEIAYLTDCIFTAMMQDSNGDWYDPDVGNIMSYYGGCRCHFTYQQYERMAQTYLNGPGMW